MLFVVGKPEGRCPPEVARSAKSRSLGTAWRSGRASRGSRTGQDRRYWPADGPHKAAIEAGGDPAEIGPWITEARAQRVKAEANLRQATVRTRVTREEIETTISNLADIAAAIKGAEPELLADAYGKLGLRLAYDPSGQVVHAAIAPHRTDIGKWLVFEGELEHATAGIFPGLGKVMWAQ
jgi:hypothetical protein